jgi:putative flippase GtrA
VQRLQPISPEAHRVAKFAVVGVGSTMVTFISYAILIALGVNYLLAGPIAWSIGLLNGYTWNRIWTFDRASHNYLLMGRYYAVGLVGLSLNTLLLALEIEAFGAGKIVGEIVALPIVVLSTFFLNRRWVFGDHLRSAGPAAPKPERIGSAG